MSRSGKSPFNFFIRSSTPSSTSPPPPPPPPPPSITPPPPSTRPPQQPPNAFLCPISGCLMADPVIIPTGLSFERACIRACQDLNFTPPIHNLSSVSSSDFLSFPLTPNLNLKEAILDWCRRVCHQRPLPVSQQEAHGFIERLKASTNEEPSTYHKDQVAAVDDSQGESSTSGIEGEPENLAPSSSSSSSDDQTVPLETKNLKKLPKILRRERSIKGSLIQITSTFEPSTTRPPAKNAHNDGKKEEAPTQTSGDDTEEARIFIDLNSHDASTKEVALYSLYHAAVQDRELCIALCSERILALIIPMLHSLSRGSQLNATAAIVVLASEKLNRSKIVRWRVVPALIHVLTNGTIDARANAAVAMYYLAIDEQDRMVVGAFRALPPLLENFCERFLSPTGRRHAGLALYHLTLSPCNLPILEKMRAVPQLLDVATDRSSREAMALWIHAIVILYNLAEGSKGREELMDAGALPAMLGILKEEEGMEMEQVQCLALMHRICTHCPLKFKELAIAAGAEEVLTEKKRGWGKEGKKMAKEMLGVMLERDVSSQEHSSDSTTQSRSSEDDEQENQEPGQSSP